MSEEKEIQLDIQEILVRHGLHIGSRIKVRTVGQIPRGIHSWKR